MSKLKITILGITTAIWLSGMLVLVPMTVRAADNYTWSVNLKLGSTGADVKALQQFLNKDTATKVATTGVGSPGNETSYFGTKTKAAVVKFQEKYAADILTPIGLTKGTGNVASMTRAKLNALYSSGGGGVVTPPTGTGLALSSPTQPAATLAPGAVARLPFTKVTFTAGTDGDVVISGVNVERTGLAVDAVFAGVVLLDENGQQLGIAKTFNSDHKLVVGDSFTVKAGQSRTMTIAGNMAGGAAGSAAQTTYATYAGQVAYLSVTGAVTSATVTGVLPITGAGHTINGTLNIGTATVARGVTDPGTNQASKEVGVTGYTFSAIRITAGSAEKIRVKSVRWNQSGSAAATDLANLKTYVDGVAYDTVVSSDGKYYTSTFGDGIVVDKGNNIELAIKGDITGGSARTIEFDIYKNTDLYVTGETYGYGITPPVGSSTATAAARGVFQATNPWYAAFIVTVSNGTLNVDKATAVAAQNIAINLSNQPLGGFTVEVKGEPISVASMYFRFTVTTATVAGITNISLVDENGTVVAGPQDGVGAAVSGYVRFTDTVTFPVGKKTYTLKGKLSTAFTNNDTVVATTTPSTDWTIVTGQTTGNTITPSPTSVITANTMTVKSTSLVISVSGDPVAQTVVSGGRFTFANYRFDASGSGEDVRMSSVPLAYTAASGTPTSLTSCQLYYGSTALNTGSNIVNPTASGSSTAFTFDGTGLIVPKGTVKTISLACSIAAATSTGAIYQWGISSLAIGAVVFSGTGLTSGQSFTPTATANTGQQITLTTGGVLTVTLDSSSPSYTVAAAGTTGVPLAVLKFHAATEAISLTKISLKLSNTASSTAVAASSTVTDLTGVSLWADGAQVGTVVFTTGNYATSTLATPVLINKDSDKLVTVKGDLSAVGISQPGAQGALVAVNYNTSDLAGTYGIGQNSGTTIPSTSATIDLPSGVRMFRSYPTFAKISLSTAEKVLASGTGLPLYKFSVTSNPAGSNGLGIYQFAVNIATSAGSSVGGTTTVNNLKIYAYTDSGFSSPVSGSSFTNGQIITTVASLPNSGNNAATTTAVVQVPAGSTYYFKVTGDIVFTSGTSPSGWVRTYVDGDTAYTGLSTQMGTVAGVASSKLIWSPNATTSAATTTNDWTNGYYVGGLPSTGMDSEMISK